jgi:hypothetical protein
VAAAAHAPQPAIYSPGDGIPLLSWRGARRCLDVPSRRGCAAQRQRLGPAGARAAGGRCPAAEGAATCQSYYSLQQAEKKLQKVLQSTALPLSYASKT